jgi:hypothetical protein
MRFRLLIACIVLAIGDIAPAWADPCAECEDRYKKSIQADRHIIGQGCVGVTIAILGALVNPPAAGAGGMYYAGCALVGWLGGAGSKTVEIEISAKTECAKICSEPAHRVQSSKIWFPDPKPAVTARPRRPTHNTRASQTSPDVLYGDPAPRMQGHDPGISSVVIQGIINRARTRRQPGWESFGPTTGMSGRCPPGTRRSPDNPNCHVPGTQRRR